MAHRDICNCLHVIHLHCELEGTALLRYQGLLPFNPINIFQRRDRGGQREYPESWPCYLYLQPR